MFRIHHFIVSTLVAGACSLWSGQAAAAGGAEAPGVLTAFKCDETTVSEAIDLGGGDWSYRYAARCQLSYAPRLSKPRDQGWGLAGPEPGGGPESSGRVLITGVGTYRAKTNTAYDAARIEGNLTHHPTSGVYALDLGVQSKYRCTRDPFLYQSGAVCTRKAMTTKGQGWSQFKALTLRREVPFGTWGITLAARNQIGKKGKPIPPPPPPPPKPQDPAIEPGHHQPLHKAPTDRKKPKKKVKRKLKKRLKKRRLKKTKTRGG